jgi:hypothetical protein
MPVGDTTAGYTRLSGKSYKGVTHLQFPLARRRRCRSGSGTCLQSAASQHGASIGTEHARSYRKRAVCRAKPRRRFYEPEHTSRPAPLDGSTTQRGTVSSSRWAPGIDRPGWRPGARAAGLRTGWNRSMVPPCHGHRVAGEGSWRASPRSRLRNAGAGGTTRSCLRQQRATGTIYLTGPLFHIDNGVLIFLSWHRLLSCRRWLANVCSCRHGGISAYASTGNRSVA